jgi:hypothetical protein
VREALGGRVAPVFAGEHALGERGPYDLQGGLVATLVIPLASD